MRVSFAKKIQKEAVVMITQVLAVAQGPFILQLESLQAPVFTLRARFHFQLQLLVGAYSMCHHVERFNENYEYLDRGRSAPAADESTATPLSVSSGSGNTLHATARSCQRYAISPQSQLQLTSYDGTRIHVSAKTP